MGVGESQQQDHTIYSKRRTTLQWKWVVYVVGLLHTPL